MFILIFLMIGQPSTLSGGAIAGIVIAVLVVAIALLIAGIVVVAVFIHKRNNNVDEKYWYYL